MQFFLLYRCAELTLLRGHDYFVVIDSTIPIQVVSLHRQPTSYRVVLVVSTGAIVGATGRGIPRSRGGQDVDTNVQEVTIQMFDGRNPGPDSLAYDARELLEVLPLKKKALATALNSGGN